MPKPSWGGAASGAISGASAGSAFGPAGSVVGGIVGGVTGLFGSQKKKKAKKVSTLDPQQEALYGDYVKSLRGEGPFSDMYNYDAEGANRNFDLNVSRPAYRKFQENIIPGITGQFRQNNLGTSSYAGEALGRAGRNVQENLDAQRSNMQFQGQQNAQSNKQSAINNILGMQTFAYDQGQAEPPGMIDQILGKIAPQAGEWFADYLKGSGGSSGSGYNPLGRSGSSTGALNEYSRNVRNAVR